MIDFFKERMEQALDLELTARFTKRGGAWFAALGDELDSLSLEELEECRAELKARLCDMDEISRRLDTLPAIVQAEGYPDVQTFTATYARQRPSWASITGSWPSGRGKHRSASDLPGATRPGHREASGSSYSGCRPRADGSSHAESPLIEKADEKAPPSEQLCGAYINTIGENILDIFSSHVIIVLKRTK